MATRKTVLADKQNQVSALADSYCQEHVNEEYKALCRQLISKMASKREVPFVSGRVEIWAAAVVHAIGTVNFLFDPATQPHARLDTIYSHFGVSKSTVGQKSKCIRDLFKMGPFGPDFLTAERSKNNPFAAMISVNGFVTDISP